MSLKTIWELIKNPKNSEEKDKRRKMIIGFLFAFVVGSLLVWLKNQGHETELVFVIIAIALYLFTTEKLPVDMTAMLIMVILILLGLVTPSQGVSGFSNTATITVLCMFILSAGIEKTGIIQKLGNIIFRFAGNSEIRQILAISLIIAPLSGFINNTAAVAVFLPMILSLSKRSKTPATKLLIPLSFISMLGGTLTLIGTSTNILANSIIKESSLDLEPFGMFEFSKIGLIVLGVGMVYFLIIGRFLLPKRETENPEDERWNNFLAELKVEKGSSFIGKSIREIKFETRYEAKVIKILRGASSFVKDLAEKPLEEGDILVLLADEQKIIEMDAREKEKLLLDFDETKKRLSGDYKIVKIIVKKNNLFNQRALEEIGFWKRYSAAVIGISREDLPAKSLSKLKLDVGEILLVKVNQNNLGSLKESNDLMVLEEVEQDYDKGKTALAVGIMALVIGVAALKIQPIMVTALAGVLLMFLTGCLKPSEIYNNVSWRVIFLLAGVIPMGIAMQETGAADLLADSIVGLPDFMAFLNIPQNLHGIILIGIFYLTTTLLTEIISNNAAVVLLVPIGLSVASKLGLNHYAFALAVMFAASTSFLSPVGYQTNTMIYSSGNYKFSDFIKVGGLLNLILLVVTTYLISLYFGI